MITVQMDGSQVFEKDNLGLLKYLNFKKTEKEYTITCFLKQMLSSTESTVQHQSLTDLPYDTGIVCI